MNYFGAVLVGYRDNSLVFGFLLTVSPGEGTDSGLASVLSSLEFCLKPCGSEASILEDLSKAINVVHTRRNLAENDRVLLNRAHRAQQEYERYDIFSCSGRYFLNGSTSHYCSHFLNTGFLISLLPYQSEY
jgi:hypothetical protein